MLLLLFSYDHILRFAPVTLVYELSLDILNLKMYPRNHNELGCGRETAQRMTPF